MKLMFYFRMHVQDQERDLLPEVAVVQGLLQRNLHQPQQPQSSAKHHLKQLLQSLLPKLILFGYQVELQQRLLSVLLFNHHLNSTPEKYTL